MLKYFIYIKSFFITIIIIINDAYADIVDDKVSFEFSHKAEFKSPLCIRITEVSMKTFCRKREGETLLKWFFTFNQLEKFQNEYYPDNLNLIRFAVSPTGNF